MTAFKTLQERDPASLPGHLLAMDEELRRLDIVRAVVERKKQPSAPIARALYRGDDGKRVVLHLALLHDQLYGLLFKPKHRYAWTEGSLHDVLATVPERWFDQALRAADEASELSFAPLPIT